MSNEDLNKLVTTITERQENADALTNREVRYSDNGTIPENPVDYESTWCTWCGENFEYPVPFGTRPVLGERRYCTDDCKASQAARVASTTDPDQLAINAYLERTKNHPGFGD